MTSAAARAEGAIADAYQSAGLNHCARVESLGTGPGWGDSYRADAEESQLESSLGVPQKTKTRT